MKIQFWFTQYTCHADSFQSVFSVANCLVFIGINPPLASNFMAVFLYQLMHEMLYIFITLASCFSSGKCRDMYTGLPEVLPLMHLLILEQLLCVSVCECVCVSIWRESTAKQQLTYSNLIGFSRQEMFRGVLLLPDSEREFQTILEEKPQVVIRPEAYPKVITVSVYLISDMILTPF